LAILKPLIGIAVILLISAGIAIAGSQGSVVVSGTPLFLVCATVGFLLHWLVFVPSYLFQTEHFFDLTGSISYIATVALALLAYPEMDLRGQLICLMIAIWAARLGSFLFMRVRKAGKDRRFDEIKTKFFRFAFTWTLGGAWVFITMAAGLAAITSAEQIEMGIFGYVGATVWLTGFVIEVVADKQKTNFRSDPSNADKFINTGLWSRSRHPNYFGEIVLWLGITLMALPVLSGWQYVTLVSPIFVILLLVKVSGVKLLEESGLQRWKDNTAYQEYLQTTPVLVPRLF
jgi:steroid 5-alpha reductase family enzyme